MLHERPSKDGKSVMVPSEQAAPVNPVPTHEQGLRIARRLTREGVHPYDEIEWELRDAVISNEKGEIAFEQRNVEVPRDWSQLATNVVAQKYFRGQLGSPEREHSVKQLIDRVVQTAVSWGRQGSYFADEVDAEAFEAELTYLLVRQMVSFNSPVWFNCGIEEHPQVSACFINSVEDTMPSILGLAKTEGMLFKYGSGTGSNLSTIRSSREMLAGGGTASGPVSFMRGYDAFAGVIKSGGKTRRAAKMVMLNIEHPDIEDFITCKADEEKKAWALIDAGYSGEFNVSGGAYDSVFFQNANHSVRVSDDFMSAVVNDGEWQTRSVLTGKTMDTLPAKELMRKMADAAWICGDPGIQYHTTINTWHTCPNTGSINASNPCSEYMFLDDSACNLASLNLMKYRRADGEFDTDRFCHAVDVTIAAMEIWVQNASYPTQPIEQNSHEYRPLGLGYANLGALLMAHGLPYNSKEGRAYAAAVTALMCGQAYKTSAKIAANLGPFAGYERNQEPFVTVMRKHQAHAEGIDTNLVHPELLSSARHIWADALALGQQYGYRNAQATVLAPTGTIAFMAHRGLRKRKRHDRGRSRDRGRAPSGVRLCLPAGPGRAFHRAHGPREDDGRGAAVPLRGDFQDRQHARRYHRGGDRADLHGGLEARPEVDRDLSRRVQTDPAAGHQRSGRHGDGNFGPGPPAQTLGYPGVRYPQVLRGRPRGLHHGGAV